MLLETLMKVIGSLQKNAYRISYPCLRGTVRDDLKEEASRNGETTERANVVVETVNKSAGSKTRVDKKESSNLRGDLQVG